MGDNTTRYCIALHYVFYSIVRSFLHPLADLVAVFSKALAHISNLSNLLKTQKVVSMLYVGGAIGACIGGSLCDEFGRKTTIMLTDFVFILGAMGL